MNPPPSIVATLPPNLGFSKGGGIPDRNETEIGRHYLVHYIGSIVILAHDIKCAVVGGGGRGTAAREEEELSDSSGSGRRPSLLCAARLWWRRR
jgi:hypothetical protein